MSKIQYQPFVKRLDLSVIGDENEPVLIHMPSAHSKIAAELNPEITQWNEDCPPGRNIERILVIGFGSQEGYGPNVNGDGFHEKHLLAVPKDVYLGNKKYDKPMFKTFVDFSKLYKHHRNRMHDQAYGTIPNVFYNIKMRRVEIPIDLFANEKSNIDILENLERNIFPAVSMGFRCVPGDVCSVCGNYTKPFPTRGHYCNHLRNNMLQIDQETGKLCYAINHNGYFFDLSIVGRPADRIAYGMRRLRIAKKVEETIDEIASPVKEATHHSTNFSYYSSKLAEEDGTTAIVELMEKETLVKKAEPIQIPDGVMNVIQNNPDPDFECLGLPLIYRTDTTISKEALDHLAKNYDLKTVFATMVGCGICPKPQEFQRMVLVGSGLDKYADYLDAENIVFDVNADEEPDYRYDVTTGEIDPKIANLLRETGIIDQRSYYAPFLMKRASMIKEAIGAGELLEKFKIIKTPLPRKKLPEDYQEQMTARGVAQGMAASPQGRYYQRNPNPIMNDGRYVSAKPEGATVKHKANPIIPLAILAALFAGGKWLAGFTRSGPLSKEMSRNPLIAASAFGASAAMAWAIGRMGIPREPKTASLATEARSAVSQMVARGIEISAPVREKAIQLGRDYAIHILGGLGISYGLARRAEHKREIGKQPNILEETAEKNPILGSAAIAAGLAAVLPVITRKFASDEVEMFEMAVAANDYVISEHSHDYLDQMARLSLNKSALLLKR